MYLHTGRPGAGEFWHVADEEFPDMIDPLISCRAKLMMDYIFLRSVLYIHPRRVNYYLAKGNYLYQVQVFVNNG